jgi:hypothetical protein
MVPGSIPGVVPGFFSDISPSDCSVALGSTQPLVKMSTGNIPGGKGGRCVRLTTSPPSCVKCHEIWDSKPPGTLWATLGLLQDCFLSNKTTAWSNVNANVKKHNAFQLRSNWLTQMFGLSSLLFGMTTSQGSYLLQVLLSAAQTNSPLTFIGYTTPCDMEPWSVPGFHSGYCSNDSCLFGFHKKW